MSEILNASKYRSQIRELLSGRRELRETRGTRSIEVINSLNIMRPGQLIMTPARHLNRAFAIAEFIWILTGHEDLEQIAYYNKNMRRYSDDGRTLTGAYGPRIRRQLEYVIDTLTRDPNSRQAALTIWTENPGPSKDIPCTIMFHFLKSDGRLNLHTYMRSNDIILGFPYDTFTFGLILEFVAHVVDLPLGMVYHNVGTLHLYEHDIRKAECIVNSEPRDEFWPIINLQGMYWKDWLDAISKMEYLIRTLDGPHGDILDLFHPCPDQFLTKVLNVLQEWKERKVRESCNAGKINLKHWLDGAIPCVCGGEPVLFEGEGDRNDFVYCSKCDLKGPEMGGVNTAIAGWNAFIGARNAK